jgi:UDP-N-acetylmuramoylalanine--D-glutamate ligase
MTPVHAFSGQRVALFGLGGSGLATARALMAGGADVIVWDDQDAARDKARAEGMAVADLAAVDFAQCAALILAPGVPLTHPTPHWTVPRAREAHIPVIGDIELFCLERARLAPDAPFIAITGTNGKSTTTALIAHMMRVAGFDVQMGGNIGTAILSLLPPALGRVHVIECSSYQIDLAPSLAPTVGILLNITPDHLDRHGTMQNYASVKERLVARAERPVIGVDDDWCRAIASRLNAPVEISVARVLPRGFSYAEGWILKDGVRAFDLAGIGSLRGAHNGQNAAAAIAAAEALGLDDATIKRGLTSFPGLAHRMEQVGFVGRVLFINDSKATNADAAEKALLAIPHDIFWVCGGVPKEGGIAPLAPLFARVREAFLIGQASDDFARTLGNVPHRLCGDLQTAVRAAYEAADASDAVAPVVLLSPACASFDQYRNFELRGAHFRALVEKLPQFRSMAEV